MQAQQVAIANQIIQALRETHVVNEVINNTINQIQSSLQVDCCLTMQSPIAQAVGAQYASTARCIALHQTLCAVWEGDLAAGQIVLDSQINHLLSADCLENFPDSHRKAVMMVPLLSGNRYLGAMGLYSEVFNRQWTAEEVAFGRAIADHLAILVEQVWLRQRVQHIPTVADSRTNQAPSFSALVEQSPEAIARYDRALRYVYVNPATEREWGFATNEMIGKTDRELGIPEDQLLVWEMALQQTFASNQMQILELSIPFTHQLRYFQARLVPEVGLSGDVEFVVSICRDITERKQAEEDTKLLQTMTQAIFESEDFHSALHVALQKVCEATRWDFGEAWVPNADQTFLESSSAFYSKHESLLAFRQLSQNFTFAPGVGIPGRVWRSQKPEWCQDVSAQPETIYLRAQMAQKFDLKAALGIPILTHKEVLTVLVFYMFEAREEDERLIQLISASTELGLFIQRKQAESEVFQSLIKERELNQLKSNFITMVSHEFRTPLSIIVLSTEVLERYGDQYEADKKRRICNAFICLPNE